MFLKLFKAALVAAVVAVFVQSWPDIRRYIKIRQM
jgi:uncharacterized protein DUF6893